MQSTILSTPQITHRIKNIESIDQSGRHNKVIAQAWSKIAPWWPLKNIIATNPLQGFEDRPFEQAITEANQYFGHDTLPTALTQVNAQTIKWCQVILDEGQAVLTMPYSTDGHYHAWRELIIYDDQLHQKNKELIRFFKHLPASVDATIATCLNRLDIHGADTARFLTLLLTSLPGWASYIKYQNEWTQNYIVHKNSLTLKEYLALRLIVTCALFPNARTLLHVTHGGDNHEVLSRMINNEITYKNSLLHSLQKNLAFTKKTNNATPDAQFIFCIDVRSEPIRRLIEKEGNYETFGFAGFFGIPTIINDSINEEQYAACPVLISPKHTISKTNCRKNKNERIISRRRKYKNVYKALYQSLKYTFTTPFILADALGLWCGLSMLIRTCLPGTIKSMNANNSLLDHRDSATNIDTTMDDTTHGIAFTDQCAYAENALRMIGLTKRFSTFVILCGHGSETENNAFASSLECGACGGHDGATNAKILAEILNSKKIRTYLRSKNIFIPNDTHFIAGLHNTTTDAIDLFNVSSIHHPELVQQISIDLKNASQKNNALRCKNLPSNHNTLITHRSKDWSETRPEWGLARNAAFIVGPRSLTQHIDLDGRTFLHSYDWQQDTSGDSLTTILTAPMVVAQWINSQYLFSTLDNIIYGSGSKITHNVVGKIGVMQGNASDLMTGLPLQSIMKNDRTTYHEIQRLLTVVYAPRQLISAIIQRNDCLIKLFKNGWVQLSCIEPSSGVSYELQPNLQWQAIKLINTNQQRV